MSPLHSSFLCTQSVCSLNTTGTTSDNMEVKTSNKRAYISMPKKSMAAFAENYQLDHGLVIKELNPYVTEGYVRAYFKEWGTITGCKIKKNSNLGENKAVAFVRFSVEEEADRAEWAGPHYIGGDVVVKRVVSPKLAEDSDEKASSAAPVIQRRRSMGLGYILEDAQWLENE